MATCPKGHSSAATDYCDECGAPMTAPPAPAPSTVDKAPNLEVSGEPCPECGAARGGRFCEVCGHDFLATPAATATAPDPPAPPGSDPGPPPDAAATAEAVTPGASPTPGEAATPDAGAPPATGGEAVTPGAAAPPATGWRIVVSADRAYYERMRDAGDPDAEAVPFPVFCPERRFVLAGPQVLVGRRSRSRGIEPDVDLTGPPEDAGVSHTHALFVAGPGSAWSIVDLDSANGTYVNDSTEQLAPNQPVPLSPGDRIHIGAWTTMTVLAG